MHQPKMLTRFPVMLNTIVELLMSMTQGAPITEDVPADLQVFSTDKAVVPPCLKNFMVMLYSTLKMTQNDLVCVVILLDRFVRRLKVDYLPVQTLPALWMSAVILARKTMHDKAYFNSDFAALCYTSLDEINARERYFVQALDWEFMVTSEQFDRMTDSLTDLTEANCRNRMRRIRSWTSCPPPQAAAANAAAAAAPEPPASAPTPPLVPMAPRAPTQPRDARAQFFRKAASAQAMGISLS